MNPSPEIHVGIVSRETLNVRLSGNYKVEGKELTLSGNCTISAVNGLLKVVSSLPVLELESGAVLVPGSFPSDDFGIPDVVIGIDFHWQKEEFQQFRGSLKLIAREGTVTAVNIIPLESYLQSVISSEMSATSSLNLLRAHAIISRSWLVAQISKNTVLQAERNAADTDTENGDTDNANELIRWFDREDHVDFHVCADDHCQRYQGITKMYSENVVKAVNETSGEVLWFEGEICDTRYSKSCGGVTETFENCWEPVHHNYLQSIADVADSSGHQPANLTEEENASKFILSVPAAFCNTADKAILSQVLNDYDQETENYFRWTVRYEQEELSSLIRERSGYDFGNILSLVPVQRGNSGRLVKLRINGTKKTYVIGKELLIRKWLSRSHLYSAAFVVEEEKSGADELPKAFVLRGAGWGHGVGLCQIGAAVMGEKGYSHKEILAHYFLGAEIKKIYS